MELRYRSVFSEEEENRRTIVSDVDQMQIASTYDLQIDSGLKETLLGSLEMHQV